MTESNDQLQLLLENSHLKNVPILVFANKQDIFGLPADDIMDLLKLNSIIDRNWSLCACSALKGEGNK
jgi:signal recognition particle receptor subunit beta